MISLNPRLIIIIGFFLVLFGCLTPFLMVLRVIQPSFLLSFLSYGASISGLMLGLVGAAMVYSKTKKGK